MTKDDIDNLVGPWRRGEAHGVDSIGNAIIQVKENLIRRSGGMPVNIYNPVGRTRVANYANIISSHAGVSNVNKAIGKSKHRVMAENSHQHVACLLGLIYPTYFLSVSEEDLDILDDLKDFSEDRSVFYDIVSAAHGTAVYPVKPGNIWYIDDSSAYTIDGLSSLNDKEKWSPKNWSRLVKGTIYDSLTRITQ